MNTENNAMSINEKEEMLIALKGFDEFVNLPLGGEVWCCNSDGSEIKEKKLQKIELILFKANG